MPEIKSAERPYWPRLLRRRFYLERVDDSRFCGYVSLICMDEVRAPLIRPFRGMPVCLVDNGYSWLQHFPAGEHFTLTTQFDQEGRIVQQYIDIIRTQGVDERGIPWIEDLYLDISILPTGETELLDRDELDQALEKGDITPADHAAALREAERLLGMISKNELPLLRLAPAHRAMLLKDNTPEA
jgi:uncharacterized protein